MDIEQMKKYFKNKIESEKLTKQVRDVIKTSDWQKQDMREGFKETFTPLIKSQESIKKSIDEQQSATLDQLKKNQLALTDKENKLDKLTSAMLAIMEGEKDDDATGLEGEKDNDATGVESENIKDLKKINLDFEKNFNKEEIDYLKDENLIIPRDYLNYSNEKIENEILKTKELIKKLNGKRVSLFNYKSIDIKERDELIESIDRKKLTLQKNKYALLTYLDATKIFLKGKGIFYNNPHQLLDRLELLGGSIIAGNNGVINEFSQIAHLLAQMKVITKKQLNELLQTYVINR